MELNIANEMTQQAILRQLEEIAAAADGFVDVKYTALVSAAGSRENVDALFAQWWKRLWKTGAYTRTQLLERWFALMPDSRIYGVRFPAYSSSPAVQGELTDFSAVLGTCTPGTDTVRAKDPYAGCGAFWCVEVEYEIDENGEIDICRVALGDEDFTRSGIHGMVGVAQKSAWQCYSREGDSYSYRYCAVAQDGFEPLPECVAPDGTVRTFMVHAKYLAGYGADGLLTSASGLPATAYTASYNSQMVEWRRRGENYAGISVCDLAFRLHMVWLKYARKGNSGVLEGCTGYNQSCTAAVSEVNATRLLVPESEGVLLLPGSWVCIGDGDRAVTYANANVRIVSIERVTVNGTDYRAVYFNGVPMTVVAGVTRLNTMPWGSGSCDRVLGLDGSPGSCTSGKEPFIIQGLESMNGAYVLAADVIHSQYKDAQGNMLLAPAVCRMAADLSGTVTEDYVRLDPPVNVGNQTNWQFLHDLAAGTNLPELMVPEGLGGGASSSTGMMCAVLLSANAGNYAWRGWHYLGVGGTCGLGAAAASTGLSTNGWNMASGAPGSAANRGVWKCRK